MLTFKDWVKSKARRKVTQEQRAQIVDIEVARKFVMQAIQEALALNCDIPYGLLEEDLDRIFQNQPVHFDGMGYVPHHFQRQDIKWWGEQMCARLQAEGHCAETTGRNPRKGTSASGT